MVYEFVNTLIGLLKVRDNLGSTIFYVLISAAERGAT